MNDFLNAAFSFDERRYQLEHSDEVLVNVHHVSKCSDNAACPIHNRSNHCMRAFPQHWRADRGIIERICPHGVGHPDPDQLNLLDYDLIHGCCGCCTVSMNVVKGKE